ncbi:FecR family protein [Pseudogemmobacter humi]|uniref:Fec operon regulator FecR n=1 Tax=Pseudogemmobacter humi TaxID=2483812 RepID=A0A3P5WH41_9RHOB|nr:FecR domain-containing protein [Pseudogemmobacter humi]VDC22933.1 fec operon regulator FecR [Pseudogemmobacter humi]
MARNSASRDERRAAAARWLVAIAADPAVERSPALCAWLEADPANARALDDARLVWQIAGTVAPELAAPAPRRTWNWPRLLRPAGLALAACALAAVWLDQVRPDLRLRLSADHVSAPGPLRDLALADGSRALLDGGSALDFAADAAGRIATLRQGAAWFDVAKDGRPFTVRLGETEIRALGTRFGVRDCGACVEVTLEEGSVEIAAPGFAPLRLSPGQQLRLLPGQEPRVAGVDAPEALAWREGRYVFYDVSLREVASVLARHGAGAIFFADETLASRPISGSIGLEDAGAELGALSEALGFRIIPLPGGNLLM